jgi:hypothetical protein
VPATRCAGDDETGDSPPVTSARARVQFPRLRWVIRLAWGVSGLGCAAWFAYEDRGLTAVVLLAAGLCLASGLSAWARQRRTSVPRLGRRSSGALAGLLAGAAVGPGAALLILIKTGLHAHPLPDFTAADLGAALSIWPAWTGAGLAAGWAIAWLAQELAGRPPDDSIVAPTRRPYNRPAGGWDDMSASTDVEVFLCPRCLDSQPRAGTCPRCGLERIGCRPGDPDDPCRRPLVDASGQVRTRAPLWWLRQTVGPLTRFLDQRTEKRA